MTDEVVIAEVMEFNPDLVQPEGLSEQGQQAYKVVLDFLVRHELTYTGGCVAFHNPSTWTDKYGKKSVLVVVHEGSEVGNAFSYDCEDYKTLEAMQHELAKFGLFAEQCTGWYSAIYECGR